jgi:hypothetical protein
VRVVADTLNQLIAMHQSFGIHELGLWNIEQLRFFQIELVLSDSCSNDANKLNATT